ncbi:DUF5683 domain-containing protein [Pararhodonellum marinum]|uniref:DUF5683 domain-containing protein n=1 Tax=Pararhodonellum marinum TaxID=2755358 RepID=UPI00293BC2BE|nr:DUF5683 domain-containing protein [Pararhodonellum marinum]
MTLTGFWKFFTSFKVLTFSSSGQSDKYRYPAMTFSKVIAVFVYLFLTCSIGIAQEEIVLPTERQVEREIILRMDQKNPRKATLLSAMLPGAGQVYNGKAWKVPIIYGGFMTNAYFTEFNNRRYQIFRDALFQFRDPTNTEPNPFPNLNEDGLIRNVNYWRRNRDATYIIFLAIYVLNIVDANVDAHLSNFDVSDDLSLRFDPTMESLAWGGNMIGLSFKIKFQ